MTAVIQIEDKYTQQFQQFVKTLPKKAMIKLTLIKDNIPLYIDKEENKIFILGIFNQNLWE